MAVYEVFAHPELRRYKTTIVSKASVVMAAVLILTFIPPLFIVYRSYGMGKILNVQSQCFSHQHGFMFNLASALIL